MGIADAWVGPTGAQVVSAMRHVAPETVNGLSHVNCGRLRGPTGAQIVSAMRHVSPVTVNGLFHVNCGRLDRSHGR
jgi:hypothetical protein